MRQIIVLGVVLLAGCTSSNSLYFGTYTRIGIDASSDGAGIGAKNAALNVTPPKEDGSAFDVIGTSDIDISYTNTVIKEEIAVGDAAKCAAQKVPNVSESESFVETTANPPAVGPVIFGTYSSWSLLDLSWGETTTPGINFGYKRGTGVRMPIVDDNVGSVYASITVNTSEQTNVAPKSNIGGTRNKHTFATGQAAVIKASESAQSLNGGDPAFKGCLLQ